VGKDEGSLNVHCVARGSAYSKSLRIKFLTAVALKIPVFWDVMPYRLVDKGRR
jgi:hypothetical protein